MSDESESAPPQPPVLDDAIHAAEQTRSTVKWAAGALAGIPTLTLLGVFIRAPGDEGWDEGLLALGLAAVVCGAAALFWTIFQVLRTASVDDAALAGFDITKVPDAPSPPAGSSYLGKDLVEQIRSEQGTVARQELAIARATVSVKDAEARSTARDLVAKSLELRADSLKDSKDADARKEARDTAIAGRLEANSAAIALGSANALLGRLQAAAVPDETALARLREVRAQAVLLKGAETVTGRLSSNAGWVVVGVTLVALGVFLLAVAPLPKTDVSSSASDGGGEGREAPTLVQLSLTPAGKDATGCQDAVVAALVIEEKDEAVSFVTLPSTNCPRPVAVTFDVVEKSGLFGSYVAAPVVMPSPSATAAP